MSPQGATHSTYPDPLIVPPQSGKHLQTFIILHGRGDNVQDFGPELLNVDITGLGKLPDLFPDVKFIFPTAAERCMKRFADEPATQWFDIWAVDRPNEQWEIQVEGLRESTIHIHGLLESEIAAVGGRNVALWGMSQGCATSLIASLLWTGKTLGGVVGMCGWLPLVEKMKQALNAPPADANQLPVDRVVECLRKELQLPSSNTPTNALDTPIFLGHGHEDEMVPVSLGHEAEEFLKDIGINVRLAEFAGLEHWYHPEMLRYIVQFISGEAGWSVREP